jgi:hypothetical protein
MDLDHLVDATGDVKAGANFYEAINSTNTQGLVAGNYDNMVNLLANRDDYQFNILSTPGLYDADYASTISTIILIHNCVEIIYM